MSIRTSVAAAEGRSSATCAGATTSFLRRVLPLGRLPDFAELSGHLTAGLVDGNGSRVLLPIPDREYQLLTQTDQEWADWIEPVSNSNAYDLARLVSVAVYMAIELPSSVADVAGHMGKLFHDIIWLLARKLGGVHIEKRRIPDQSTTLRHLLPDLWLLVSGTLLFKAEEKTHIGEMPVALEGLSSKMSNWSAAYHGHVQYLLCYAAAELAVQFCALPSTGQDGHLTSSVKKMMPQLNLAHHFDRLCVVHTAMLVYCIVTQQYLQLPSMHTPLAASVVWPNGVKITYMDTFIIKQVPLIEDPALAAKAAFMESVYAAVRQCPYVIHATEVKVARSQYTVHLEPVGLPLNSPPESSKLASAARCILQALRTLHGAGWGHGDLRWPNVIRLRADTFVLIDLEGVVRLGSSGLCGLGQTPLAWGPNNEALDGDGLFTARSDLYMLGCMLQQTDMRDPAGIALRKALVGKALDLDAALAHPWLQ